MIIAQHATTPPLTSSRLDYAVGRVLWALTDGLAAKHFAELSPVPPLEWLGPLAEAQFTHEDLRRFGVTPNPEQDDKLAFSVIRRPPPYPLAPEMSLADFGSHNTMWDDVMHHLANWLTRHLDNPKLVLWLAKQGGQLNDRFSRLIQLKLKELEQSTQNRNQEQHLRIHQDASKIIPSPLMRTFWRLLLSGRVKSHRHHIDLYDWLRRFRQDGLTPTLRIELREILTPRVAIREPFRFDEEPSNSQEVKQIKDLVNWEIVLSSDHVHSALHDIRNKPEWELAIPELLQDFSLLLRDILDLMRELDGAHEKSDLSYIHQPSISKHPQNNDFRDWTALITLTRDSWVATAQNNPLQAQIVAEGWWQTPYPLFKRLAFFAAANTTVISPQRALDWILADTNWWLWSVETQRELMRLIVGLAPRLDTIGMATLEDAILKGPPREMYKGNIDSEEWVLLVNREIWLRLKKAHAAGVTLGEAGTKALEELTQKYPDWKLASDESDEFPYWMGEAEGMGRTFSAIPTQRREMIAWLKQHPSSNRWQEDDWRQRCRDDFPTTTCSLFALSTKDEWPTDRWREALQAWAEDKLLRPSWRYMTRIIALAPDDVILKLDHALSWWLEVQAKTFVGQEKLFFQLIRRLLKLKIEEAIAADSDPVSRAINHPVGRITEAVLRWWYRQGPKEREGLPIDVKILFTDLCNTKVLAYRHGRVVLAAHAISLFRADEGWTRANLLPIFDWERSEIEARAAWEGFLWSPRLYLPFLSAIKPSMLAAATRYSELGNHAEQFATFLTFAALDSGETFTKKELEQATSALPAEGLQNAAQTLVRALDGAGEQREEYWRNRVLPYFISIWPKSRKAITPSVSESLARLCVAARHSFPEAFEKLRHWLQPVTYPDYLISQLYEAGICEKFPTDALKFIERIIGDDTQWLPHELQQCLDQIKQSNSRLAKKPAFIRLINLLRRRG